MTDATLNQSDDPSFEDVQEALQNAEDLLEEIEHYRDTAQAIDDNFLRDNEDRKLNLDDIPYGEELNRTCDLPESLEKVICNLTKILDNELSTTEVFSVYQEAMGSIQEARDTLEDCTDLPQKERDDDSDENDDE